MSATIKEPHYQGVDVNHPSIVSTIKNMVKQGEKIETIQKVVGMPREVIERHSRR